MKLTGDCYIGGQWAKGGGESFESQNPADGTVVWEGSEATDADVLAATATGRAAFEGWSTSTISARESLLEAFASAVRAKGQELAELISGEAGKPLWEAKTEVTAVAGKAAASIEAYTARASELCRGEKPVSRTWYRPHGVVGVLSPFNFPAHMGNGHVMPALLAGNCVVLKPSELTPGVAEFLVRTWEEVGLPAGVLNLVQGGRAVGESLTKSLDVRALYLTGGEAAGKALSEVLRDRSDVLLALELGGNSPLVVWDYADVRAAVLLTIQSTYVTAGQRCSAARRLIVPEGQNEFLDALKAAVGRIHVGSPSEKPEPYMGPMINGAHVDNIMAIQDRLEAQGGRCLVRAERIPGATRAFVRPGLIDVTDIKEREDGEVFGPLLQVIRVANYDEALAEADATRFGLAAGLVSESTERFEEFSRRVEAGIVNWNQQLTGASGMAPFGGLKASGNHRPSGFLAVDYCTQAVATMANDSLPLPEKLPSGLVL